MDDQRETSQPGKAAGKAAADHHERHRLMVMRPQEHASYNSEKMSKTTLFRSERLLVGLNAFEHGQEHPLHAHEDMDKVYHVVEGRGVFLLEGRELDMRSGELLIAPRGVPHGIRNTGEGRLLVLAILAPSPGEGS